MTNAKSNHSSCPTAHTELRQPGPVCQVERLNVPLEEKLTAKPDRGKAQFCLLSSVQPFFFFNLTLPFKQNEKLDLCLAQIWHPRLKFWDPAEVRCFWKGPENSQEQKGMNRVALSKGPHPPTPGVYLLIQKSLSGLGNTPQTTQWQEAKTGSGIPRLACLCSQA